MAGPYHYTPDIWAPVISALLLAALGAYSWSRREMPGTRPFAIACLFSVLWMAGIAAEAAAAQAPAKVAWVKFQGAWQLPAVTAMTCFGLEYVYPGRWLNRRTLIALAIPPLVAVALMLTNDWHHLMWSGFTPGPYIRPVREVGAWALAGYGFGLGLINIAVFVGLFIRSPEHRWPVVLIVFGQLLGRGLYLADVWELRAAIPLDPVIISVWAPNSMYAVALFGFRIFDPLPAARRMVIAQLQEGMVVFDALWRAQSLNPMAESILGIPAGRARGQMWQALLPDFPDPARCLAASSGMGDLCQEIDRGPRIYALSLAPLKDHRALVIGYLLLLRDVTEQRQAQAQMLAQQWAEATLQEREQLAHELHDGLSQNLAFLNLQAQAAQLYLQGSQPAAAQAHLARLAEVARQLQRDVRELIGNLLTVSRADPGFCGALRQALAHFQTQNGLLVCLEIEGDAEALCDPARLSPVTGVQLVRVVQEALTNVRKHAGNPSRIRVALRADGGQLHLVIEDNGAGFDPARVEAEGGRFGLQIMRQRIARAGGQIAVHAAPGQGTRIEARVPLNPAPAAAGGHRRAG